jgi:type IV pilus assembly protein PilC
MRFSAQLPLASLLELCRMLRHSLGAGLSLVAVFRQQGLKGPPAARPIAERIHQELERGHSLQEALEPEAGFFPPLFLSMVRVGEESGTLPEVFGELEKYFQGQVQLRRRFRSQIAWPAFQYIAAVLILAFLLCALGYIAQMHRTRPLDPLGLGLTGVRGAIVFLFLGFGIPAALIGGYVLASRKMQQRARVDALLLRLPVAGPCLRALALSRFCLALRLTSEAGVPIVQAMRLSLEATGNAAFIDRIQAIQRALKAGDDLTLALAGATDCFPEQFQNIIAVAEESGRLPEVMRHQAAHYEEEAGRRLKTLASVAAWAVWAVVAGLIIVAIFRMWGTVLALH